MLTIPALTKRFRKLNTDKIITDSLKETVSDFEDIQRKQLMAGKTRTGSHIKPSYRNKKYAEAKSSMNPLPGLGVPDLRLTGAFYEGIDVEAGKEVFDIISKDEKGPELENKYRDIFGLGGAFKNEYTKEKLEPALKKKISKFTGLKFQ